MHEPLSLRIRNLLNGDLPFAFCDACLALRFAESLEDARAAAIRIAGEQGFIRTVRVCYACRRDVEMTECRT